VHSHRHDEDYTAGIRAPQILSLDAAHRVQANVPEPVHCRIGLLVVSDLHLSHLPSLYPLAETAIEMRGYQNLPVRRGNDPEPLPTLHFRPVAVDQQLSLLARLCIPRLPDDGDVPLVGDPVTTRVSVRPYTSSRKWSVILIPCTLCSSPRSIRRLGATKQPKFTTRPPRCSKLQSTWILVRTLAGLRI
jgi:hypothetical protein